MYDSEKIVNRVTMAGMLIIIAVLWILIENSQTKTGTFEQQNEGIQRLNQLTIYLELMYKKIT